MPDSRRQVINSSTVSAVIRHVVIRTSGLGSSSTIIVSILGADYHISAIVIIVVVAIGKGMVAAMETNGTLRVITVPSLDVPVVAITASNFPIGVDMSVMGCGRSVSGSVVPRSSLALAAYVRAVRVAHRVVLV